MISKGPFQAIGRGLFVLTALFLFGPRPPCAEAYRILFYYNSSVENGVVLRCAAILQKAGNQVDAIDVAGRNHDPLDDDWGVPYDQVWDMRFTNRDKLDCGSGSPKSPDYFDSRWRSKAVSFLNHCGNFFIAGEHYQLADRDEGLYEFLREIRAVKEGFDPCPPSRRGNSTTGGEDFYPVRHGLGPVSFFGEYVGGIPLALLNGTNYVDTDNDWQGDDGVDRSMVSGWKGTQMGGEVWAPACARGKLFMVWDATMWTLWDAEVQSEAQRTVPVWDDSAWFSWDPDARQDREGDSRLRRAQAATRKFFPAVALWLGAGRTCPCEAQAQPGPAGNGASSLRQAPTAVPRGLVPPVRSFTTPQSQISSGPGTIVFSEPPVNIYMRFRDGPGEYRVTVLDGHGNYLRTVFDKRVLDEKEAWTAWDGTNENGSMMSIGDYSAVLSKDGIALRKITLTWIYPPGSERPLDR